MNMLNFLKTKKLMFLLCFICMGFSINPYIKEHFHVSLIPVSYYLEYPKGSIKKSNLDDIPDEYLLAMVAIHECINLYPQDAKYICEATWNRVELNWGGYGQTLAAQLKSSEFKGLIDSNFYFNPFNKKHLFALECAKRVLEGEKEIHHKQIVGWLTHYDNDTKHVNRAMKRVIATPTWHKFWVK